MFVASVNCKMAEQALLLIILLCLNVSRTLPSKTEKCDDNTTKTTGGIAYWKFRGVRYTTSEDFLCWKENGELFLRECNTTTGQWHPEEVVCQEQEESNKYCPEELVEIHSDNGDPLCLKISPEPQKYDDEFCRGSNVVFPSDLSKDQMLDLVQFLYKRNIKEYWLPLRRENNTMPFKIRLPGKHWGQIVDDNIEILDFKSDRCCVSAEYSQAKKIKKQKDIPGMMIQDCEALLHSICIFQDEFVTVSGCPEGLGALSYRPNVCYGVNWKKPHLEEKTQISINEYFQNRNTLRQVLKSSMPKKKKEDEFFQVDDFSSNSGDNYVILMNQNERVKVADKSSKIFPVLYKEVVNIELNAVELILKMDVDLQKFILIVYNRQYLWRSDNEDNGVTCFTNSDYDLLRSTKIKLVWENEMKSIFEVKLIGDGPGEYWCEGHTIVNFQLVSSSRVVTMKERRGHAFSIRLNAPCIHKTVNLCNNIYKNAKKMAKHIQEVIREKSRAVSRDLVIHNVRIMSIEKILHNHIDCWIHLTASLKNSAVDNSDEESSEEFKRFENDERIRHDTSIRMKVWMLLRNLVSISIYNPNSPNDRIVRSTEYCFPDTFYSDKGEMYQWNQAVRGQMGTLSHLCLQRNGLPYMRQCQGEFLRGAYWEELKENVTCQLEEENTIITKTLYSLESSKTLRSSPEKVVREVKSILKKYANKISPADIHFTANILQSSVKLLDQQVLSLGKNITTLKDTTHDLISIYNYMVDVKRSTIKMSASLNSTNKLLEAFENAMNTLSSQAITDDNSLNSSMDFEVFDFEDIGVTLKASNNLLYFILNPTIANISGIAMFKNDNSTGQSNLLRGAFQMEHFRFLQSNHDVADFINETNLQVATYVPEKLLTHLNIISNTLNVTEKHETIIVIKVYSNDILFQQQNKQDHRNAFGRVVSISLPGHSTQLPEDLPLVFRVWGNASIKDNSSRKLCSYWNFENWVSDGIRVPSDQDINKDIVLCQVEAALQTDPNNEELLKLKDDLEEVIKLTRDLIKTQLEEQRKSSYIEPSSSKTASSNYFDDIEAALLEAEKLVTSAKVWKIGDKCQAKWTEDGQYYDATIEGITGKGEVSVIFDAYQNRSTTTINELRERTTRNEVFPSNKRHRPNQKEYLKKRKQKKQQRFKDLEEERESDKNKWLNFTTKNQKKPGMKVNSIFASPDNVSGRVGIGTCGTAGKGMTDFTVGEKYRKGL
ncbi:uncharacterized protein LOC117782710 isoform X1 [Drosophila innubila]|uniref:uncharacterized protein LOC117782710 isoform X1 n=1 Tax=Drosophila innubila TaxID=198719 RepID=UPI00148D23E8|nr:uncharacterized protein LOC117782710 isoform X1 [Drosophila innubila]